MKFNRAGKLGLWAALTLAVLSLLGCRRAPEETVPSTTFFQYPLKTITVIYTAPDGQKTTTVLTIKLALNYFPSNGNVLNMLITQKLLIYDIMRRSLAEHMPEITKSNALGPATRALLVDKINEKVTGGLSLPQSLCTAAMSSMPRKSRHRIPPSTCLILAHDYETQSLKVTTIQKLVGQKRRRMRIFGRRFKRTLKKQSGVLSLAVTVLDLETI